MIIDYSTARPSTAQLKAAGITAAGRYIGWDSVPGFRSIGKNLTRSEAGQLHGAGISVFVSFEYAADAATRGKSQGAKDGTLAGEQLAALGAPGNMGVYFAVDFDIPDYAPHLPDTKVNARAKLGPAGDYFQVINEQQPHYRVGGYGGYYAVKRLFDAGLISLGWQTVAWSGGQRDTRAQIYQTTQSVPIGGADFDVHEGSGDFGQWGPGSGGGEPALRQGLAGQAVKDLQAALNRHGAHLAVDGAFGPATTAALKSFQSGQHLTADGICGPLTWAKLT